MDWQAVSNILSSAATIVGWIAVLASAWWFLKRRPTYPRANYTHKIEHFPIDCRNTLMRVLLTVENKGDVLLKLVEGCVRIYQMKPWPAEALLHPLSENKLLLKEGQNEIDWTMIAKQDLRLPTGIIEVEPGETAEIPFDFVIGSDLEIAIVYSYVRNTRKAKRQIGWDKSTTYVFRKEGNSTAET